MVANPGQEAFRDESGNPAQTSGLRLQLSNFAPKQLSEVLSDDDDCDITISMNRLGGLITETEEALAALNRHRSPIIDRAPKYTVVRRPTSPPSENDF